jgi:hypothetical protein
MAIEAGIPLTLQLIDSIHKELLGLLPEPMHHHSIDAFLWLDL